MSVGRVTEISATSSQSFEDAIQQGVKRASETLRGIQGAWVKEQNVQVSNGKVDCYKVNLLVTFLLEGA